jgi:hypothetical protein
MEKVREQAMVCVGRAVFFGYLGISMVMLGSMFDLVLFFRTGAVLTVVLALVLLWFAQTAETRKAESTETWLLLDKKHRPQNEHAIKVFGQTMKEVYVFFATAAIWIALGLAAASILFTLLGIRYIFKF